VPGPCGLGDCPLCRDPFLVRAAAIITLVRLHTHPLVDSDDAREPLRGG